MTGSRNGQPLVSIGIPTYNRAEQLSRSVASALAQDHANLEVLVSDNGSTDDTLAVARNLAESDPRVRVLAFAENRGPTANFNHVRAEASGAYFMWLGDDDWLDDDYVSSCLAALVADPTVALAAGQVVYHDESDGAAWLGVHVEPRSPDAGRRVIEYWETVRDNGAVYGLVPAEISRAVPSMANRVANDMQLMTAIAFLGRFRIVDTTTVHRAVGGATTSIKRAAEIAGLPWWQGEYPQLAIAWFSLRDIGWVSPVYGDLSRPARVSLGLRAAFTSLRRFLPEVVPKYVRLLRGRARARLRPGAPPLLPIPRPRGRPWPPVPSEGREP